MIYHQWNNGGGGEGWGSKAFEWDIIWFSWGVERGSVVAKRV